MGDEQEEQVPEQEQEVPDLLGWATALVACIVASLALKWLSSLPATTREDDELWLVLLLPFIVLISYRKSNAWLRRQLYARVPKD